MPRVTVGVIRSKKRLNLADEFHCLPADFNIAPGLCDRFLQLPNVFGTLFLAHVFHFKSSQFKAECVVAR